MSMISRRKKKDSDTSLPPTFVTLKLHSSKRQKRSWTSA
jgi:hypothetical protein